MIRRAYARSLGGGGRCWCSPPRHQRQPAALCRHQTRTTPGRSACATSAPSAPGLQPCAAESLSSAATVTLGSAPVAMQLCGYLPRGRLQVVHGLQGPCFASTSDWMLLPHAGMGWMWQNSERRRRALRQERPLMTARACRRRPLHGSARSCDVLFSSEEVLTCPLGFERVNVSVLTVSMVNRLILGVFFKAHIWHHVHAARTNEISILQSDIRKQGPHKSSTFSESHHIYGMQKSHHTESSESEVQILPWFSGLEPSEYQNTAQVRHASSISCAS